MKVEYIPIDEQVADIFTKALPRGKHVYFRDKMGDMVRNIFLARGECYFCSIECGLATRFGREARMLNLGTRGQVVP